MGRRRMPASRSYSYSSWRANRGAAKAWLWARAAAAAVVAATTASNSSARADCRRRALMSEPLVQDRLGVAGEQQRQRRGGGQQHGRQQHQAGVAAAEGVG